MNILSERSSGAGNWIVAACTKPRVDDDGNLVVIDDEWKTSGHGRAEINTYVAIDDEHMTSILVAYRYSGKYRGGSQYWQHYRDGKRVTWKQLDDGERMLVLDAYATESVPGWANIPGKLKRDYNKPGELQKLETDEQGTIYGYKYLVLVDDVYHSTPAGHGVAWNNNELEADLEPTEDNTHGIYAMKSRKNKTLYAYRADNRRLVRLALSGTVVEANEGLRAQHAQIVEVLS